MTNIHPLVSGAVHDFVASVAVHNHRIDDVHSLLREADTTSDDPPSPQWVPVFAKLMLGCRLRIAEWQYLTDRLDYFARRVTPFVVEAGWGTGSVLAFEEIIAEALGVFPLGSPWHDARRLWQRLPGTGDLNELMTIALNWERTVNEHRPAEDHMHYVQRLLERWVRHCLTPQWSAHYIVSVLNYYFRDVLRSPLFDEPLFQEAINDETVRTMHLKCSRPALERAFSDEEIEEISQLLR